MRLAVCEDEAPALALLVPSPHPPTSQMNTDQEGDESPY